MPLDVPLSLLDLAPIARDGTAREALQGCVRYARAAERLGFERVWYAEHHNMPRIASSATAVLIAHVAAHTERIRLGAGGVMLPNHAPLVVAEQFGTLAELHPGRIELGLGRAPGTDPHTLRALRRDHTAADAFPQDVLELQGYLRGEPRVPHVHAVPGRGTDVPLFVLGSSLFGAQLAAALGLPYAFASHFAPAALRAAVAAYRDEFRPSAQLEAPRVIAGVNVVVGETEAEAREGLQRRRRDLARGIFGRPGRRLGDAEVEAVLASPQGVAVDQMLTHTAVGTPDGAIAQLGDFRAHAEADELILVVHAEDGDARVEALKRVADAAGLAGAPA